MTLTIILVAIVLIMGTGRDVPDPPTTKRQWALYYRRQRAVFRRSLRRR